MSNSLTIADVMSPDLPSTSGLPTQQRADAEPILLKTLEAFQKTISALHMFSDGAVVRLEPGSD